jgi:hypothetical protein
MQIGRMPTVWRARLGAADHTRMFRALPLLRADPARSMSLPKLR